MKKMKSCRQKRMLSTQLQNRSFHVVNMTRTASKDIKTEKPSCKACKTSVLNFKIRKYLTFASPWSMWLP